MLASLIGGIFGTKNERELKRMRKIVDKINALEPTISALSDADLSAKTEEFKQRYNKGESLDKLLPEATTRALTATQDTVTKLNSMSETIADLAKSYEEAASTVLEEKDIKEQELSNEQIFREELEVNISLVSIASTTPNLSLTA